MQVGPSVSPVARAVRSSVRGVMLETGKHWLTARAAWIPLSKL